MPRAGSEEHAGSGCWGIIRGVLRRAARGLPVQQALDKGRVHPEIGGLELGEHRREIEQPTLCRPFQHPERPHDGHAPLVRRVAALLVIHHQQIGLEFLREQNCIALARAEVAQGR